MKQTNLVMVLGTVLGFILGCNSIAEPEWAKAKMKAGGLESPSAFTTDDKFIYFVTGGHLASLKAGTSGVWKIPIEIGRPVELFKGYQKDEKTVILPDTFVLAVDEKYLYFAAGSIYRVPKDGGDAEQITAGKPTEMVVDEENIYWHNFVGEGMQPTPVYSISKKGGEVKTLTDAVTILDIAVDKENFYWSQPDGIYKKQKNGGEKSLITAPKNGGRIMGMIIHGDSVYFLDNDVIFTIPKTGGDLKQITTGVNTVHKFYADEKNIYFVKNEGSFGTSINKVPINGGEVVKIDSGYIKSFSITKEKIIVSDSSKIYELPK